MIDRGHRRVVTARALVNATGAWTASVADTVLRVPPPPLGTIQISQIVVKRLFDTDNVYVFQNRDRRLIFASPYERDFTLIGTVGHAFKGDPAVVSMAADDVAYLCDAANRYFRERVETADVVRTVSGVNSVLGRGKRGLRRDGALSFDARRGKAPLMTMFGGDITTSRLRAERAVSQLTPFYPMSPRWTAKTPLPGGDFAWASSRTRSSARATAGASSAKAQARRLVRPMARGLSRFWARPRRKTDLGPAFGPDLTGAEVRYLMTKEWARFPDDVLWRRSKLGLTMPAADREALAAFMASASSSSASRTSSRTSVGVRAKMAAEGAVEIGDVVEAAGMRELGDGEMRIARIAQHAAHPRQPLAEHEGGERGAFLLEQLSHIARGDAVAARRSSPRTDRNCRASTSRRISAPSAAPPWRRRAPPRPGRRARRAPAPRDRGCGRRRSGRRSGSASSSAASTASRYLIRSRSAGSSAGNRLAERGRRNPAPARRSPGATAPA